MDRNKSAAYGLHLLKRAVLSVLYDRRQWSIQYGIPRYYMSMKDIRERLGLDNVSGYNDLMRGVLNYLRKDGYVEELLTPIRWQITKKGIQSFEV